MNPLHVNQTITYDTNKQATLKGVGTAGNRYVSPWVVEYERINTVFVMVVYVIVWIFSLLGFI